MRKISSVRTVVAISPPIMTIARGFRDYEPIPVGKTAGISQMEDKGCHE